MLIVNADDWGRSQAETDAALDCCQRGTVTSVSAMVFMADSERAAKLATDAGIDVGLHLNLTEPFASDRGCAHLKQCQARIARLLKAHRYAVLFYHPLLRSQFREVYRAQAAEFARCYGRDPSHVDGHQHMHLCANMLVDAIIPRGQWVRRSFSFQAGEKGLLNRTYRNMVNWCLGRRYRLTRYFLDLSQNLEMSRFTRVVELAKRYHVELMTHPYRANEYAALIGDAHSRLIRSAAIASYSDLHGEGR